MKDDVLVVADAGGYQRMVWMLRIRDVLQLPIPATQTHSDAQAQITPISKSESKASIMQTLMQYLTMTLLWALHERSINPAIAVETSRWLDLGWKHCSFLSSYLTLCPNVTLNPPHFVNHLKPSHLLIV